MPLACHDTARASAAKPREPEARDSPQPSVVAPAVRCGAAVWPGGPASHRENAVMSAHYGLSRGAARGDINARVPESAPSSQGAAESPGSRRSREQQRRPNSSAGSSLGDGFALVSQRSRGHAKAALPRVRRRINRSGSTNSTSPDPRRRSRRPSRCSACDGSLSSFQRRAKARSPAEPSC